jgi:hypothetical protein
MTAARLKIPCRHDPPPWAHGRSLTLPAHPLTSGDTRQRRAMRTS